ncbi:hypothetical protein SAMN04488005_0220 [Yoonia tamlensis]|uniref:Uncharacterized protein n=1 Tax=Yoonia tamlensis TaxID=390270 RepID=A0A1I6FPU7_9RHOB|nr:hypothetical protein [Yoonia tamlensis]SFR31972.1 hypothetical protein SAMN04488005_0220 [Yoonia tamlensis]
MAFIRLVVVGLVVLTMLYWMIAIYSRSVRRERLEKEFDALNPENIDQDARDTYVEAGMTAYNNSLRPKLIGLVYVVPAVVIATMVYLMNAN